MCILLGLCVIFLWGCEEKITEQKNEKKITIVTSFYPLATIVQQIVGDEATVINIAQNQEVHEYTPTPRDMEQLNAADIVIYMGGGLEPWVADVIPQIMQHNVRTVAITERVLLYEHKTENDKLSKDILHNTDEAQLQNGASITENDTYEHGRFDPHVWLDPVIMQDVVRVVLSEINDIDSEHAEVYTENAHVVIAKFASVDQLYKDGLSQCTRHDVIISHEVFGYVGRRYNVHFHAIAGLTTTDEPSAKTLADMQVEAVEGITHVLVEQNSVQRFAQTLAQDTGLQILGINALENGTGDPQKNYYDVMRENLDALRIALDCI